MDLRYAAAYGAIARAHWWWATRDAIVLDAVTRLGRGSGRARLLDVGCGDGRLLDVLAESADVVGIEADASTGVRTNSRYTIHVCPFTSPLPLSGPFDVIMMLDVLEHLAEPVRALELAATLLAPDGRIVITVPALQSLWTSHDALNHHFRRYTRKSLEAELRAAELMTVSSRYFFHALIPAKLAVRLLERVMGPSDRIPTVPRSWANRAARRFFGVEFRATERLGSWLPGSSLLAIVRAAD